MQTQCSCDFPTKESCYIHGPKQKLKETPKNDKRTLRTEPSHKRKKRDYSFRHFCEVVSLFPNQYQTMDGNLTPPQSQKQHNENSINVPPELKESEELSALLHQQSGEDFEGFEDPPATVTSASRGETQQRRTR